MNLNDVMTEIGEKLSAIAGLRVFPYNANKVVPPGAIVDQPEGIAFDMTYRRGMDSMDLSIFVMVGKMSDRASNAALAAYADGSGTKSIKSAVDSSDSNTYASCDTVTVASVEFAPYTSGGVALLGAEFKVKVTGSGS